MKPIHLENITLHYCTNGRSVTDQVIKYKESQLDDDYLPIMDYYSNYVDHWFLHVEKYIDKETFESEFNMKLVRAVNSFNTDKAKELATKNNWTSLGMFNRWFFRILENWLKNIKSDSYRVKKNPCVQCPICGRHVARIDMEHLEHYKTVKELPKVFVWKGEIFETCKVPKEKVICYGKHERSKIKAIKHGRINKLEKYERPWLWKRDGKPGVVCPFTKKIIESIDNNYIRGLEDKYSRYAKKYTWEDFITDFPGHQIQHELYSLDYGDDDSNMHEKIRCVEEEVLINYNMVCEGKVPLKYRDVFSLIDENFTENIDRCLLKLLSAGYTVGDISESMGCKKEIVQKRLKSLASHDMMCKLRDQILICQL